MYSSSDSGHGDPISDSPVLFFEHASKQQQRRKKTEPSSLFFIKLPLLNHALPQARVNPFTYILSHPFLYRNHKQQQQHKLGTTTTEFVLCLCCLRFQIHNLKNPLIHSSFSLSL
ncbi:hypothetical protein P8452_18596 [Trifolium repens]|nr:hypothetical protein P8452_18596 [Trifolium repens]